MDIAIKYGIEAIVQVGIWSCGNFKMHRYRNHYRRIRPFVGNQKNLSPTNRYWAQHFTIALGSFLTVVVGGQIINVIV
jgi:hypothetical protein